MYAISDDELEFPVHDRISFMEFLGLGIEDHIPDAKTVWLQSFQRFWGMGELSIHRWKGFELYPVINKKTVSTEIYKTQ